MAKRDRDDVLRLVDFAEAKRREAEEIFARVAARIEGRRRLDEQRRRRRLLRTLTFGRRA